MKKPRHVTDVNWHCLEGGGGGGDGGGGGWRGGVTSLTLTQITDLNIWRNGALGLGRGLRDFASGILPSCITSCCVLSLWRLLTRGRRDFCGLLLIGRCWQLLRRLFAVCRCLRHFCWLFFAVRCCGFSFCRLTVICWCTWGFCQLFVICWRFWRLLYGTRKPQNRVNISQSTTALWFVVWGRPKWHHDRYALHPPRQDTHYALHPFKQDKHCNLHPWHTYTHTFLFVCSFLCIVKLKQKYLFDWKVFAQLIIMTWFSLVVRHTHHIHTHNTQTHTRVHPPSPTTTHTHTKKHVHSL